MPPRFTNLYASLPLRLVLPTSLSVWEKAATQGVKELTFRTVPWANKARASPPVEATLAHARGRLLRPPRRRLPPRGGAAPSSV